MVLPRNAVSIAVFRRTEVLLVRRGKEPWRGCWSLPGGSQHAGETMAEATRRELLEETGLEVPDPMLVEIVEPMRRDGDGRVLSHFVLGVHAAADPGGEATAGDDAAEVAWVPLAALDGLDMTPGTAEVIGRAHAALASGRKAG